MSSREVRQRVLDALAAELRCGPRARRRILIELADHIDDAVEDLRGAGMPQEEAMEEAVNRLGDAEAIANAFGDARAGAGRWSMLRTRRSLAWAAVGAMSVVMACAAEVPQASGAKPRAAIGPPAQHPGPAAHPTIRRSVRLTPTVAPHGRPHRGDRG